jgi:hypothetical protein
MFAGRFSVSDRQRVDERRLTPPPKLRLVANGWLDGLVKEAAYGKSVWFWHPWLVSNRRRFSRSPTGSRKTVNSPLTEAKGIRLRGERAISRQTIAQGRPDALRWTCMLVCALPCAHCTRDRGCSAHPVFPAPSLGESFGHASGALRREIAKLYPPSLRAKRSNPLPPLVRKDGLLRFARNNEKPGAGDLSAVAHERSIRGRK